MWMYMYAKMNILCSSHLPALIGQSAALLLKLITSLHQVHMHNHSPNLSFTVCFSLPLLLHTYTKFNCRSFVHSVPIGGQLLHLLWGKESYHKLHYH